jgi:N-methylhydantoinase B/oxoprolinase/acetone carboxylase alpha subunit
MAEIGLIGQARSILSTIRATLKDGHILASPEVVEQRAAICMACPKLREKAGKYSCTTCGCGFKRKIAVSASKCPIEKW